ncbi:MAG: CoA ester lyase [Variovorax sp.]|nr:CoA ester lyase [Variovorax sp.]
MSTNVVTGCSPRDVAGARTLLFVPGDRPERFEKAAAAGAGGIILDLEDAVGADRKPAARQAIADWLPRRPCGARVGVRINGIDTLAGLDDLRAFADTAVAPDFYVLPKLESAAQVRLYATHLCRGERPPRLVCAVETAQGLDAAPEIAAASPLLAMLGFGGGDLARDLGNDGSWDAMLYARSRVVQAAAAARVLALDMPWIHLRDEAGLIDATRRARALGYRAKLAIHPSQVAALERELGPTSDELAAARRIVQAYQSANGSACVVDGHLVDAANHASAQRLLVSAGEAAPPPPALLQPDSPRT